jgi:hypothetical protein
MVDLDFKGLSSEATVGKVLVLLALLLKVLGILTTLVFINFGSAYMMAFMPMEMFGAMWTTFMLVTVVLSIIGIFLLWKTFDKMAAKDFHGAGIYALIATVFAPIDVISLIAGVVLLVSPEAKGKGVTKSIPAPLKKIVKPVKKK